MVNVTASPGLATPRVPHRLRKPRAMRHGALCGLILIAAFAIAGPSGLLAWQESYRALAMRRAEITCLIIERNRLNNHVALLDPGHVDADYVSELIHSKLNVTHPDDMVLPLPHQGVGGPLGASSPQGFFEDQRGSSAKCDSAGFRAPSGTL